MLSKKYGEIDTKHLFDGISDKDVEDNIQTAENTIQTSIDRCDSHNTAIIGLKETEDGSRFWSIFSIDYNYTGNKFNY